MRSPQVLLLLPILCFVLFAVYSTKASEEPTEAVSTFLRHLQRNDIQGALRDFGDNTCHCAPEGGYIAYLQYESGHDPNLAFLLGRRFELGKMRWEKLPYNGEKYAFPWDKPEDTLVFAPITFASDDMPFFVPMDTAFGIAIPKSELTAFESDPSNDWMRAFTMRLRPTLRAGFIPPRDPAAERTQAERAAEEGTLPKEYLKYLHPKDAGDIKEPDGKLVPAAQYAAELPKLKSIVLGLKVVRRGIFQRWAVQKIGVEKPIIVSGAKEFTLVEPAPEKK